MIKEMATDIEIERNHKLKHIKKIAAKINLNENDLEMYGKYIAKINPETLKSNQKNGNLILVTAINPTSSGEGKTTISIGLNDALNIILKKEHKNSILALREPSLGPVFGIKGGATGGGFSQVCPMIDINLHFTGDFHAITTANNLLSSMIDNYIFQDNILNIDPNSITFNRCIDLNDRALRNVIIKNEASGKTTIERNEKFNITAASEIMAILSLSKDIDELKTNLGNILIGYSYDKSPIFAKDIKANDAMTILLKDAIKPNLVQSLEGNPVLIHCGPFANIAHGCNSIIATKLAMTLGDYVVTEAGFGADLGAEKFLDIKCRKAGIIPNCVVIVATVKALKLHGDIENVSEQIALLNGLTNLKKHLDSIINVYHLKCIVAINKFFTDTIEEINTIKEYVEKLGSMAVVTNAYNHGGKGSLELAKNVIELCNNSKPYEFTFAYNDDDSIIDKITKVAQKIYGARDVIFTTKALNSLSNLNKLNVINLPVCIAKTQYSLSDNPKMLFIDTSNSNTPFDITINDIELRNGAKMIVAIAGSMLLMPGLSKNPQAAKMKIEHTKIEGLM